MQIHETWETNFEKWLYNSYYIQTATKGYCFVTRKKFPLKY